jgi:hypothetical protein
MKITFLFALMFATTNANAAILKSDLPKLDTSYDEPDEQQLTMCPDGTYVKGPRCNYCPDGTYVGGKKCHYGPDGHYY